MINVFICVIGTLSVQIIIKMLREHHVVYTLISDNINIEKNKYTEWILH